MDEVLRTKNLNAVVELVKATQRETDRKSVCRERVFEGV